MRIEQLQQILEIARCGSIGKACHNLFLTQQSLSHSIKKLEDELNVTIFDRINTGMSLTEEGKLISDFSKNVLHEYEKLKRDLISVKNKHDIIGDINLYINKIFEKIITPDILKTSYSSYPNIKIHVTEIDTKEISSIDTSTPFISLVNFPSTEESVIYGSFIDERFNFNRLFSGKFLLCASNSHPLSKQKVIPVKTILQYPVILHAPSTFEGGILDTMLKCHTSSRPNIFLETSSYGIFLDSIANNIGVGFIYDMFLNELMNTYIDKFKNITILPIKEYMGIVSGYLTRKGPLFPEEEYFIDMLKSHYMENYIQNTTSSIS